VDHLTHEAKINAMARFFVRKENITNDGATISGEELNHLRRVLRLKPGERITLFDDASREHQGILRAYGPDYADVEITGSNLVERESPIQAILAVGLTKGEKIDLVIEKATELGVSAIAPFVSQFTVPKLDQQKIARRSSRWQKIAVSAAKQSGRTRIPDVFELTAFGGLIEQAPPDALKLIFWEKESHETLRDVYDRSRDARRIMIVVGPEGGFSREEAKQAVNSGFTTVGLGPRILRAETAAIATLAIVQSWWGDLG
jgi:16S rRNA (uracil1498-N3)-methyltransferase